MFVLQGKKVELRDFSPDHLDSPDYFTWLRDLEVVLPIYRMEYLLPIRKETVTSYVEALWSSGTDCFFAVHERETGRFIGTQRIGHINWRSGIADIGILIGERSCWNKGFATETITLACDYAFGPLSLRRLTGGTAQSNVAMTRCFVRNGFVEEGRLRGQLLINGAYEDHVLFGLLKEEFSFDGVAAGNFISMK